MTTVRLEPWEWRAAVDIALDRYLRARAIDRPEVYGEGGVLSDIVGACGEWAFAKWLGVLYEASLTPDHQRGDVAGWGVRATPRDNGSLLLHRRDADDGHFVLVTGQALAYTVRGYILGAAGKKPEYWRTKPRPAFFVPQSALAPLFP